MSKHPLTPASSDESPRGFDDFDLRLGDMMRGERATMGKSLLDVQRELKIKAAYIAAIENTDPTAFETPGFIAGYVRSYARYLGMDPDWAFKTFCAEGKFEVAHGMSKAASGARPAAAPKDGNARLRDPFADPNASFVPKTMGGGMPGVQPGAIGSIAVLIGLVALLGYGGWSVIQEVQKVRLAPIDQTPVALAEIDPLATATAPQEGAGPEEIARVEALDRLYRPEALELPILTARDAPISTLDPSSIGALVGDAPERYAGAIERVGRERTASAEAAEPASAPVDFIGPVRPERFAISSASDAFIGPVQVIAEEPPQIAILAAREAWVRVQSADGSTILEKVMRAGERFVLPSTEAAGTLRTGNAGGVYFEVGDRAYGPAGGSGRIVGDVALSAEAITEGFARADPAGDADLARLVAEAPSD